MTSRNKSVCGLGRRPDPVVMLCSIETTIFIATRCRYKTILVLISDGVRADLFCDICCGATSKIGAIVFGPSVYNILIVYLNCGKEVISALLTSLRLAEISEYRCFKFFLVKTVRVNSNWLL